MNQVPFKTIGIVRSCYPDKFGTPRQSGIISEAKATIELYPFVQPEISLVGLSDYSHLWVIFYFHEGQGVRFHAKVHPPRLGGETMGLFATRTPHRPNSIGLSVVKIDKVHPNKIDISGVDMIDGTPVLDIKPYIPEVDSIADAQAGWTQNVPSRDIEVRWQPESLAPEDPELRRLIEKTIKLDPRPLVYRSEENGESKYRDEHAVRIHDLDIWFRFVSSSVAIIHDVKYETNS